jgi:hypothetical protein
LPKLSLPQFFTGDEHRQQLIGKLKLLSCPHCAQCAYLICNGLLYGNDPEQQGCARIERGQRIRCSDRGASEGCGHSFAVLNATSLPKRSINSTYLSALLKAILQCAGRIHEAWQLGKRLFSLSTAYRIWRQVNYAQPQLRHRLCDCTDPPPCDEPEPRLQLIAHLQSAFPKTDPIQSFQSHFQIPLLPDSRKHPQPPRSM